MPLGLGRGQFFWKKLVIFRTHVHTTLLHGLSLAEEAFACSEKKTLFSEFMKEAVLPPWSGLSFQSQARCGRACHESSCRLGFLAFVHSVTAHKHRITRHHSVSAPERSGWSRRVTIQIVCLVIMESDSEECVHVMTSRREMALSV
jgi:hypothetical protein